MTTLDAGIKEYTVTKDCFLVATPISGSYVTIFYRNQNYQDTSNAYPSTVPVASQYEGTNKAIFRFFKGDVVYIASFSVGYASQKTYVFEVPLKTHL